MLPFQIKEFTSRTGDEIVLLLDRQDGPAFWPNVFVTSQYVLAGRAADTRKKVLRSIGMARMWATSLTRDLDDELSSGHFLSAQDVPSLADFLGLNAATQESRFAENRAISRSAGKASRLEGLRPDSRRLSDTSEKAALPDEVGNRIRWVAEYVDWHLCRHLGDLQRTGKDARAKREHGLEVLGLLRQRIPSRGTRHDEIALEGISEEAVAALEATLHPASDQNPFRSAFVRSRNYLAWRLIIDETPVNPKFYERMSELLSDLVKKRHDDAIDYAAYLEKIAELVRQAREGHGAEYPASIRSAGQKALFDNLDGDEDLALEVDAAIRETAQDGWRGNKMKQRMLERRLADLLEALDTRERILDIIRSHDEY